MQPPAPAAAAGPPSRPSAWPGYALAALSGALLFLSWPNGFFPALSPWPGWLAWIALVPFIRVWQGASLRRAAAAGWLMGFVWSLGTLSWLRLVNRNTNLDNHIAWLIFAGANGVYAGLFSLSARWLKARLALPGLIALPLAWAAWEYVRGHAIAGGFPWACLGHTQYANPAVRQLAVAAGVTGISFLVVAVNALLERGLARGRPAPPVAAAGQSLTVLGKIIGVLLAVLGGAVLAVTIADSVGFARSPKTSLRVTLVQGNINTDQEWNAEYKTLVMERMRTLQQAAGARHPDLVVWAESCFPGILGYAPDAAWNEQLRALIKAAGVPTVIPSDEVVPDSPAVYHHYNSAYYLGANGEPVGHYRKIKLVPFGEYVPYRVLATCLRAATREPLPVAYEPGTEFVVWPVKGIGFSPLICYEDHFEDLALGFARRGARFFASMSNDGWAGRSAMSAQHTAMSVFLAIEHRAYMVKATMTGPTMAIDPWGDLTSALPDFTPGVKIVDLAPGPYTTAYLRAGHLVPVIFCLLFLGLGAAGFAFKPSQPPQS